jgi:hypothetical protein
MYVWGLGFCDAVRCIRLSVSGRRECLVLLKGGGGCSELGVWEVRVLFGCSL